MKIVFMNGGLGNQMFQYVFLRWLESVTNEECLIDDSPFFGTNVPHNGYELEQIFGIRHKRLSECFEPDVWEYFVRQRKGVAGIAQQLKDSGLEFAFIYDVRSYHYDGAVIKGEQGKNFPVPEGNAYYHGYWLGNLFFRSIERQLRQELTFPVITDVRNRDVQSYIRRSNAVAIHIRRGDMAANGDCSGPEYFQWAIRKMETDLSYARYFLFSDDFSWCRAHWKELGFQDIASRTICVEGNTGENAWVDMQLMAGCRHFIYDRSSFSLMASYLSASPDKTTLSRWDMCQAEEIRG